MTQAAEALARRRSRGGARAAARCAAAGRHGSAQARVSRRPLSGGEAYLQPPRDRRARAPRPRDRPRLGARRGAARGQARRRRGGADDEAAGAAWSARRGRRLGHPAPAGRRAARPLEVGASPSSSHALTFVVGQSFPMHAGGASKVLLAHLPPDERRRLLGRPLQRFTERTIADSGRLEAELAANGWARG